MIGDTDTKSCPHTDCVYLTAKHVTVCTECGKRFPQPEREPSLDELIEARFGKVGGAS